MAHLSPELLVDLAEGARTEASAPHLAECQVCRERLVELRGVLKTIDVGVPEPSPLFWDHLSARVREAVRAEDVRPPSWWSRLSWPVAAAVGVAVVVLAVSIAPATDPSRVVVPGPVVADPAGEPATGEDPALSVLSALAGDLDLDLAEEAGLTMEAGSAENTLSELTAEERLELRRLLREAMGNSGA